MGCRSGEPFVKNYKETDIWKSLRAESNSLPVNESLWEKIDSTILTSSTPATCYAEIAKMIGNWGHPYFQKLSAAMKIWSGLYTGETDSEPLEEGDTKSPSQLLSYIKEPEPKTIRPKLPSESDSLLEFLHNKSQIHEAPAEAAKESKPTEDAPQKSKETKARKNDATETSIIPPKTDDIKGRTVQIGKKSFSLGDDDEILTVKILDDEDTNLSKDMKKYSQRLKKEDLKPYVANPRKLLIKKPSNDAFIPRKK